MEVAMALPDLALARGLRPGLDAFQEPGIKLTRSKRKRLRLKRKREALKSSNTMTSNGVVGDASLGKGCTNVSASVSVCSVGTSTADLPPLGKSTHGESAVDLSLKSMRKDVDSKNERIEIKSHVDVIESQENEQRKKRRKRKRENHAEGQINALQNNDASTKVDVLLQNELEAVKLDKNVSEAACEGKKKRKKRKKSQKLIDSNGNYLMDGVLVSNNLEEHLQQRNRGELVSQSKRVLTSDVSENKLVGVEDDLTSAKVLETPLVNAADGEPGCQDSKKRRRKKKRRQSEDVIPLHKPEEHLKQENGTNMENAELASMKDSIALNAVGKENILSNTLHSSLERFCVTRSKRKLLVLDLNGILIDVVGAIPKRCKPDFRVCGKAVFVRPFCADFLSFCFERFNVGIWSSRAMKNVLRIVKSIMKNEERRKLCFCLDRNFCTKTKFKTIENRQKPLVLKELRKLWEKRRSSFSWEKGEYNETNTILLDDSPYKAICNPAHTGVFPYPFKYDNSEDSSLGPTGDLRLYLEGIAEAENVQHFIEQNPFGQPAISDTDSQWNFYRGIIEEKLSARQK